MALPSTGGAREIRVVHVISTRAELAGAERVVHDLVEAGPEAGVQQHVLNLFQARDRSPWQDVLPVDSYTGLKLGMRELPLLRHRLAAHLRRLSPDCVHSHLFHASTAVASLTRKAGTPRILTHHHGPFYRWENRPLKARIDVWAARHHDRIVAVSEWTRLALVAEGISAQSIQTIHNGWSGFPLPRLSPREPTVVCVANFRSQKNHALLLEAFAKVVRSRPNAKLVLVGDGDLGVPLRERAFQSDLRGSVEFVGTTNDVWPHLARADVFALASSYEPLGISVLEAMAAGLPVVATAAGGVTELVADGVTGLLTPVGDPDRLANALVRLLTSPLERQAMGANAARAAQRFGSSEMAGRYFELYRDLAGSEG